MAAAFVRSILIVFLATTGCAAADEPASLTELRRAISSGDMEDVNNYLDGLSSESKIKAARFAVADKDQRISILGIQMLVESGLFDEAVPCLAARVLADDDLTAFGYAWAHSDEPQLAVRMYLKISRYLLARFDSLNDMQKTKAKNFIRSNLGRRFWIKEFSVAAAEQRLSQIEAQLTAPASAAPSP